MIAIRPHAGMFLGFAMLGALAAAPAAAQPVAPAAAQQQRAPAGPVDPGPSVAGHWTGQMVLVLNSLRVVPVALDFTFTQNGNDVTGTLKLPTRSINVKGTEQEGKLNLVWDFSDTEHCRLHLVIADTKLNGALYNYHDTPRSWVADETGPVTLDKVP